MSRKNNKSIKRRYIDLLKEKEKKEQQKKEERLKNKQDNEAAE